MKKEDILKQFGQRLKEIRLSRGMSQQDLANKISTSKSVISGYESGRNDPAQSVVIKLADALDVSINYLMGQNNEKYHKPLENENDDFVVLARNLEELTEDQINLIKEMIDHFNKENKGD